MSAISAAMAARSAIAADAGPTISSGCLPGSSQSPSASSSPSPSGSAPLWAPPAPEASAAASEEAAAAAAEEAAAGEAAAPQEAAAEAAASSAALVAAVAGVAVAEVHVQYHLHLCTKKSKDWVAVHARFNPPGVVWQTKAAIASKRTLGRVEKFGVLPPAFPAALLQLAVGENGVRVCSFLGVTAQVRDWVVKHFRQPAEQVRVLEGKFEEEAKKLKAAEQPVREMCGGKRQGGAGLKEKERKTLPLPRAKR